MPKEHSFDDRCYELAEHFFEGAPPDLLCELAQRLQDQVESSPELEAWLEREWQQKCAPRAETPA